MPSAINQHLTSCETCKDNFAHTCFEVININYWWNLLANIRLSIYFGCGSGLFVSSVIRQVRWHRRQCFVASSDRCLEQIPMTQKMNGINEWRSNVEEHHLWLVSVDAMLYLTSFSWVFLSLFFIFLTLLVSVNLYISLKWLIP